MNGFPIGAAAAVQGRGLWMPSLRNLLFNVVRFMPSRAAAPVGPPITQLESCRTFNMCSRSTDSSVTPLFPSEGTAPPAGGAMLDGGVAEGAATDPGDAAVPEGAVGVPVEAVVPGLLNSAIGISRTGLRERVTARSSRFCNSRMLPGQL